MLLLELLNLLSPFKGVTNGKFPKYPGVATFMRVTNVEKAMLLRADSLGK